MMKFIEKHLVEDYIIHKLEQKGWKFIAADNLERGSYEEPLLIPVLVKALKRINREIDLGDEEIKRVLNELKLTGTGIEGEKRILNFYKLGIPVKFDKDRVVKYIRLFDFENIEKNEFIVSRQVYYYGRKTIRTDIMLYVNGIPLVNIECKNPVSITESWNTAYRQIKEYEKTVPELYKYVQIGIAAESIAKYFPIVPWQNNVKAEEWRMENKEENSLHSSYSFIDSFLLRDVLLDIIKNFLFYKEEKGEATKVITRYMQYRAANKIVNRVIKNLKGEEEKNKGLIWHWQGSGKTFTMIFAANKLFNAKELENPTIFFIVDRIELKEQIYAELNSIDIVKPEAIETIKDLKEILNFDDYRGKRGVFITLIHKFRQEELKELYNELEEISRFKETIMSRKNVVVFIDEGHRTQYGMLAAQMKSILKSAFFFAFTGTPISIKRRDTYLEFSYPPEETYLDRYFIIDSIRDGFTVKIAYQPKVVKRYNLKKELLETFLREKFEELPEEISEDIEENVRGKLKNITSFLEKNDRISIIAKDIVDHFKENIDGRFKAMVVACSRKACDIYKQEFDKYLPPEYSEIVMTYKSDETEQPLVARVAETQARYESRDIADIRKIIINNFKEEEYPKILIVTDMLLTGFDAQQLQVMYLDKPLKGHRLLQAIARTNRPYKDLKEAGLIIDYIGMLQEFKRALEIYNEEDIKFALTNIDEIRNEFDDLIREIFDTLKEVPRNYERDSLLKAVEVLTTDKEKEKEFINKYKNLRKIFELLGSDVVKIKHFEDYKWISAVYTYYMKIVMQSSPIESDVEEYYRKTIEFIHKSIEIEELETELPKITFDENFLEEYFNLLKERGKSKKEKAASILFALNRFVLVEKHKNPIYESLVEKVERLLELWNEKTKDYEKLYKECVEVQNRFKSLSDRKKSLCMSELEYSFLLILEEKFGKSKNLPDEVKVISRRIKNYMFPRWFNQPVMEKKVEREIRKFLRRLKVKYNITLDEMDKLYNKFIVSIKNYGTN